MCVRKVFIEGECGESEAPTDDEVEGGGEELEPTGPHEGGTPSHAGIGATPEGATDCKSFVTSLNKLGHRI